MALRQTITIATLLLLLTASIVPVVFVKGDDPLQGAWVDTIDGVLVMHLQGTPYNMGYQHGMLLGEKARQNLRAILAFSQKYGYTQEKLLATWTAAKPYVPAEYIEEMQGLADATNTTLDQVGIAHIVPSFLHCSSFAAWGNATSDGRLIYARSFDFPLYIQDPTSKTLLQDNAVLIIREPSDGYASVDPSLAGMVGSDGGFNERGVAIDVLSCWSNDERHAGTPMMFRQRMILDHAANLTEALAILDANRTEGWNCIAADTTQGIAVEQTANHSYYGAWDDPIEATTPFWQIPSIVRRTNIFIDPQTAATQRDLYNPRVLPILSFLLGKSKLGWNIVPAYLPWRHYLVLSHSLENTRGNLTLNTSMTLLRHVYDGTADPLFHLFVRLHLYCTLHQWVACPQTGEMLIAFATGKHNAFTQPVHAFTLQELRDHQP